MSVGAVLPDEELVGAWRGVLGALGTQTIDRLPFGEVWSIATASGARFVLKRLSDADLPTRRRRFTEEARIVIHLAQSGLPVAMPILDDDGRIGVEHDGGLWALVPMLPTPDDTSLPTVERLLEEKPAYFHAVGRA